MPTRKLAKIAVAALDDIKARDIAVLDVRKLTNLYDTLIIATAESNRQVKALASHVREQLEAVGATIIGVEGEATAEWVLVDAGDVVVHIMQPAVRAHYNLEELWAPRKSRRTGEEPVPLAEIAANDGLPLAYLEHLAARLRKAGLVDSRRGSRGGVAARAIMRARRG